MERTEDQSPATHRPTQQGKGLLLPWPKPAGVLDISTQHKCVVAL